MGSDFLNRFGYAALMGILKNYQLINPFVTSTNDAFNRLKPGFEAPVCIVSSLGHSPEVPSRNRTVLIGLVRDIYNPYATRFELRAPNPSTNTYLAAAAIAQSMLDAFDKVIIEKDMSAEALLNELTKKAGEEAVYLLKDREYRSERDVFEEFSAEERDILFSAPPKTVWENISQFEGFNNDALLTKDDVFTDAILKSYKTSILTQWILELEGRIIQEDIDLLRTMVPLHENDKLNELDQIRWKEIYDKKISLMKDTYAKKCLCTELAEAIEEEAYEVVSEKQAKLASEITNIKELYRVYKRNIINL